MKIRQQVWGNVRATRGCGCRGTCAIHPLAGMTSYWTRSSGAGLGVGSQGEGQAHPGARSTHRLLAADMERLELQCRAAGVHFGFPPRGSLLSTEDVCW